MFKPQDMSSNKRLMLCSDMMPKFVNSIIMVDINKETNDIYYCDSVVGWWKGCQEIYWWGFCDRSNNHPLDGWIKLVDG